MYEQNENRNKNDRNYKRNQKENQGLKSIITEMKNTIEWFKTRYEQAEEKSWQT